MDYYVVFLRLSSMFYSIGKNISNDTDLKQQGETSAKALQQSHKATEQSCVMIALLGLQHFKA